MSPEEAEARIRKVCGRSTWARNRSEGLVHSKMTASITSTGAIILIALSASFAVVAGAKHHGVVNRPHGHLRKRKRNGGDGATRMAADKRRVDGPAGGDHAVIRDEEIEFWSRLLQGSMPQPQPTTIRPQPSTRPPNNLKPPTPVSQFNY